MDTKNEPGRNEFPFFYLFGGMTFILGYNENM